MSENNFLSKRVDALLEALGLRLREEEYQKYNAIVVEGSVGCCGSPYYKWYEEIIGIEYKGKPAVFKVLEGSLSAKNGGKKFKVAVRIDPKDLDPNEDELKALKALSKYIAFIIKSHVYEWGAHKEKTCVKKLYEKAFDFWLSEWEKWKVKLAHIDFNKEKEDHIAQICKNLVDYIIQKTEADKEKVYHVLIKLLNKELRP